MKRFVGLRLGLAALVVALGVDAAMAQSLRPWRHGIIEAKSDAGILFVASKRDYAAKLGLKLDISSFKGDGQMQQAFTAGQIDFGLGSGPSMGYRAKGVPVIAVATMYGPPSDMGIVIASNGSIKSIAERKCVHSRYMSAIN